MEKKIKKTTKATKDSSYSNEEKTVIITIVIALVIMSAFLVQLTFFTEIQKNPCSVIYYLDSEKQAENYPKTVILGENSTISLWVGVENQNDATIDYQVQIKIDDGTGPLNQSSSDVLQTFEQKLQDGDLWEFPVTINIEQWGTNRIIFELYTINATTSEPIYTGNWVNLSVEGIVAP